MVVFNRLRALASSRWVSLALVMIGAIIIVFGVMHLLSSAWPPRARCNDDGCKEAREWISSSVTLIVILGGLFQYWRSQLWKRAEFLAQEMKTFFADPKVINATTMIDWTSRHINLLDSNSTIRTEWPLVTREIQGRALLPHKLSKGDATGEVSSAGDSTDSDLAHYSGTETAIRDAYDAFLDGLERFASYVSTGLINASDLRPYLGYWISDIASKADNQSDNEWTFWLLSYIHVYGYTGIQGLFKQFGRDIEIKGDLYGFFQNTVRDSQLASEVKQLITQQKMN